jgi:hypothetical protein
VIALIQSLRQAHSREGDPIFPELKELEDPYMPEPLEIEAPAAAG